VGDEGQHLSRRVVEPLRVVDEADDRSGRRRVREQRQHREADQEPLRMRAPTQAERGFEGLALRRRQSFAIGQQRRAELVQRRERQLHLCLDAIRAEHEPPGDG
jgi:hypothetical protein